MLVDYYKSIEN
jgi:hypothetical protein